MDRDSCGYYAAFCQLVDYGDLIECTGICDECDCYNFRSLYPDNSEDTHE